MGASSWVASSGSYTAPDAALEAAQLRVIQSGEYIWPWEEMDPDYVDESDLIPRPDDVHQLRLAKDLEEYWEVGTHSVLDLNGASEPEGGFAVARALSMAEVRSLFGTDRPSIHDANGLTHDFLASAVDASWGGVFCVVFERDQPAELVFWGISGD